jgi:hypothetical protein
LRKPQITRLESGLQVLLLEVTQAVRDHLRQPEQVPSASWDLAEPRGILGPTVLEAEREDCVISAHMGGCAYSVARTSALKGCLLGSSNFLLFPMLMCQ